VTTLLVAAEAWAGAAGSEHFTDTWAVRVDGGEETARQLAVRHGFLYVDKVRRPSTCTILDAVDNTS